jgi:hypothetical protein
MTEAERSYYGAVRKVLRSMGWKSMRTTRQVCSHCDFRMIHMRNVEGQGPLACPDAFLPALPRRRAS